MVLGSGAGEHCWGGGQTADAQEQLTAPPSQGLSTHWPFFVLFCGSIVTTQNLPISPLHGPVPGQHVSVAGAGRGCQVPGMGPWIAHQRIMPLLSH